MRIGVKIPGEDFADDFHAIRDFAQAAEELGYSHLIAYDHILGAEHADRDPPLFVPYDEIYRHGVVEEMLHRIPSIEKVGSAIGWAPTRLLDDILADVIQTAGRPARA